MSKKIRWDSYVLLKGNKDVNSFFKTHFSNDFRNVLYVLGKGFDIRMNTGIENLIAQNPNIKIKCILIEYDEGRLSSSQAYSGYVQTNINNLKALMNGNIISKTIKLWNSDLIKRRRIGDREAAEIFQSYSDISEYSDIIVDVSALPRGIYFSLIGKLLSIIDTKENQKVPNFFIATTENAKLDAMIHEEEIDEDINYTHGFGGELELTSEHSIVWFPILGESKRIQIIKAHNKINPQEISPLLPFPAKDPRRSDKLIIEYHQLLFDELRIESQNLLYVHEQNPFEIYRTLTTAILNYHKTLSIIGGCKAAISTFSSKLLSIGALITAYELNYGLQTEKIGVGILNVDSLRGYKIEDEPSLNSIKSENELFLAWLTGEPYIN